MASSKAALNKGIRARGLETQVGGCTASEYQEGCVTGRSSQLLASTKVEMYLNTPYRTSGGCRNAEIDEKDAFKRWYKHLI